MEKRYYGQSLKLLVLNAIRDGRSTVKEVLADLLDEMDEEPSKTARENLLIRVRLALNYWADCGHISKAVVFVANVGVNHYKIKENERNESY